MWCEMAFDLLSSPQQYIWLDLIMVQDSRWTLADVVIANPTPPESHEGIIITCKHGTHTHYNSKGGKICRMCTLWWLLTKWHWGFGKIAPPIRWFITIGCLWYSWVGWCNRGTIINVEDPLSSMDCGYPLESTSPCMPSIVITLGQNVNGVFGKGISLEWP